MPDKKRKTRVAVVLDVGTFHERFGTDEACLDHLKEARWGKDLTGFTCPECKHGKGWWLGNRKLVECCACHRQTSVTAGTVFHQIRTPMWKWFWAMYQLAQDKKGVAALELAKQIRVGYRTAWLMLHKLRRAMRRRNERYLLQGLVEVDETYVGGAEPGHRGRGVEKKVPVAVALELTEDGKPRRIAMSTIARVDGHSQKRFATANVKKGSALRTDGWSAVIARGGPAPGVPCRSPSPRSRAPWSPAARSQPLGAGAHASRRIRRPCRRGFSRNAAAARCSPCSS